MSAIAGDLFDRARAPAFGRRPLKWLMYAALGALIAATAALYGHDYWTEGRLVAKADIAQAAADLHTAELNLGYTEITSPIEGYVGNRAAQAGAYVAGGAYLVTVIPAHDLWVDANFKESQLEHMTPGQAATIVADVMPNHVFHGHVVTVAPATGAVFSVIPPENATGNFTKIDTRSGETP